MAGLLDSMFPSDFNDPRAQFNLALAAGLLGGRGNFAQTFGQALPMALGTYNQAQESAQQRAFKQAQMDELKHRASMPPELFGKLNPSDFTPESLAKFQQTKNYGDLVRLDPSSAAPSPVREWEFFSKLPKEAQPLYLQMKRQGYSVGDIAGVPAMRPMIPGLPTVPLSTLPAEAGAKRVLAESGAEGQSFGREAGERAAAAPQKLSSLQNAIDRSELVIRKLDEAEKKVGVLTAGPAGVVLSKIPGTEATALKRDIDTVLANVGFGELQKMRFESPTGGALGQVAIQELAMLQAVLGSLDMSQAPSDLKKQIADVRNQYKASLAKLKYAMDQEREFLASRGRSAPPPMQQGANQGLPPTGSPQSGPGSSRPEATRTINGKTYIKIGGKWYEQ